MITNNIKNSKGKINNKHNNNGHNNNNNNNRINNNNINNVTIQGLLHNKMEQSRVHQVNIGKVSNKTCRLTKVTPYVNFLKELDKMQRVYLIK